MGRTVPSFRMVIAEEKNEWKPFRNALDKSEKKAFDEMWDIPKLYVMPCSGSCQLVPLQPIAMSILFHHYKELKGLMEEVKQIEAKCSNEDGSKVWRCPVKWFDGSELSHLIGVDKFHKI